MQSVWNKLKKELEVGITKACKGVIYGVGRECKLDIEELLDFVAQKSKLLNMPESEPARWERKRLNLKPGQLEQLNAYRQKFGKDEV